MPGVTTAAEIDPFPEPELTDGESADGEELAQSLLADVERLAGESAHG
jgi:hypothetical protein